MRQLIIKDTVGEVRPGIYQHFKGKLYEVVGFISDGTQEDIVNEVAYKRVKETQLFKQPIERFEETLKGGIKRFMRLPSIGDIIVKNGYSQDPHNQMEVYMTRYEVDESGNLIKALVWFNYVDERDKPYYNHLIDLTKNQVLILQ